MNVLMGLLLCAIELAGVTGENLRSRAFFDVNNARVGDPLILTVDFIGNADFTALHPPALAKVVDRNDWKVDDASAKTDTFSDGRRLVYRVRPRREGVIWFPALEFSYQASGDGQVKIIRSNPIPVHAKKGVDVVVEGMLDESDTGETMPQPDALITDWRWHLPASAPELSADEIFAWRRACAAPSMEKFAEFEFPAAKMNAARSAILDGNFAKALQIYYRLEWTIGQTEEIERGMIAALALKQGNAVVELPVWRQVGRPLLRYGWQGRLSIVLGVLLTLIVLMRLTGIIVRRLAGVVAVLALWSVLSSATAAPRTIDPFEEMRQMQEQMHRSMQNAFSFSFGGGAINMQRENMQPPKITASVALDRDSIIVGDKFNFIVTIEAPEECSLDSIRLAPSEWFGLTSMGNTVTLPRTNNANSSNVVHRIAVPVRYDIPFQGKLNFTVSGMVTQRRRQAQGRAFSNFTFSSSFKCESDSIEVKIKPLPSENQPRDFSGIVAQQLIFREFCDLKTVETNDVMTLTYRLQHNGYLPPDWMPEGAAYEWNRSQDGIVEWRRYFIADGAAATPKVQFSYYDPITKTYRRASAGGTDVQYQQQ